MAGRSADFANMQHKLKFAAVVEEQDRFLRILQESGVPITELGEIETSTAKELIGSRSLIIDLIPAIRMPDVQEGVIRMLHQSPSAEVLNGDLMSLFRELDDPSGQVRWVIGNALADTAQPGDFDALVELATDSSYGYSREMLLLGLARTKDPRALDVLTKLLEDPQLAGYAVIALGQLKDPRARPAVEPFLDHPISWIRQEARKSLKRIERAAGGARNRPAD